MRRSKPKRYGVISTRGTDLEMTPLDQEDDDDDSTLFDVQHRYYTSLSCHSNSGIGHTHR